MAEMVNVAVDAMGGDNAPGEIVKGAVEAINEDKRVKVFLVGREPVIREELKKYTYNAEQMEIVHAEEVIETGEPPVMAIRRKKDSSIVKAMYMVKDGHLYGKRSRRKEPEGWSGQHRCRGGEGQCPDKGDLSFAAELS